MNWEHIPVGSSPGLRYRSNAPVTNLSFDLANEGRSVLDMMPLPKSTPTTEYLAPCETSAEREQNQKKAVKP
jgi:hypothetical protein